MEKYALELIEKGKRIDGRKLEEFRPITIKKGIVETAEGSASVKLGETEVVVGVKLNVGEPYADTKNEGVLIVNAEFTPMASPDFESGPPGEDAVELARVVDRGLRESKCIELKKLCIVPGEKVWIIFVDIHIINHQGNLIDAAALASMAALSSAKVPKLDGENILRGDFERDLPVVFKPINITVGKVGEKFLVDPIFEEEGILSSKLSICVRDDDSICALQKQGSGEINIEDIEKMIDMALEKTKEIRKLVE